MATMRGAATAAGVPNPAAPSMKDPKSQADDDDLDPAVVTNVVEASSYGANTTRALECVQEQNGPKDDQQQVEREEQPLDGGGGNVDKRHVPDTQGDDDRCDIDRRHGPTWLEYEIPPGAHHREGWVGPRGRPALQDSQGAPVGSRGGPGPADSTRAFLRPDLQAGYALGPTRQHAAAGGLRKDRRGSRGGRSGVHWFGGCRGDRLSSARRLQPRALSSPRTGHPMEHNPGRTLVPPVALAGADRHGRRRAGGGCLRGADGGSGRMDRRPVHEAAPDDHRATGADVDHLGCGVGGRRALSRLPVQQDDGLLRALEFSRGLRRTPDGQLHPSGGWGPT